MEKRRWLMLAGAAVALVALAGLAAACDDDDDDGDGDTGRTDPEATVPADGDAAPTESEDGATDGEATVDVSLVEFSVDPSVDTVSAGTVTFNASNDGTMIHNLRVIKTDLDPDALPVDDDTFMVEEDQVEVVASFSDLDVGDTEGMAVDLDSGSYVLICNIATHYGVGMTVGFTVE